MKQTRISKEEAARLATRDRNRIVGLTVVAVLVGGLYLYASGNAKKKRAQQAAELASSTPAQPDTGQDMVVIPFDQPEILDAIQDGTESAQELLQTEPLRLVFEYARLQPTSALNAIGLKELDTDLIAALIADPKAHRVEAFRARGIIIDAAERARPSGIGNDWIGSLQTLSGAVVHFLVANAPVQADGSRLIEKGDYLSVEGLFYGLSRKTLVLEGAEGPSGPAAARAITGPLIVGAKARGSTPPLTSALAATTPNLVTVIDDSVGDIRNKSEYYDAKWELMGKALMHGDAVDWDTVPEINAEILRGIYEDGDAYRGKPFRFPVSINMEGNSLSAGDNPLRLDDYSDGWIGNSVWKKPIPVVRWIGPFGRTDLFRKTLVDDNRYITAKGFFFRNEVYTRSLGEPGRAPVFVMHSVDVYTLPKDPSIAWFAYGVLGLTVLLIGAIYLLLRSDKRKSTELYQDILRRKRARRDSSTRVTPA